MNSVRCPICEQRLTSEDDAGLSQTLSAHLSDQHGIGVKEESAGLSSPVSSARERLGGWKGAEHRREEQYWSPEAGTPIPPRPQGIGDWARKAVGATEEAGGREEWTRGRGYPSMTQRASARSTAERPGGEDTARSLMCPMCGQYVRGAGEDELSEVLEDHFRQQHRIVPRVTSR